MLFLGTSPHADVEVRFYKESSGEPQGELSLIPNRWAKKPDLTDSHSWQLDRFEGEPFALSMTGELYKLLPLSEYEVTVYSSGVAEWIAMDHRLTFVIEGQEPRDKAASALTKTHVQLKMGTGRRQGRRPQQ
jgi:hypothetical protein